MKNHYIKFLIPIKNIYEIIRNYNFKTVTFFIDIMSISRGFYNVETIHFEIDNFVNNNKQMPNIFINECRAFYNDLFLKFKQYNPKFVTFYDDGKCIQNRTIYKEYKADRAKYIDKSLLEDEEKQLFRSIKEYYFNEIIKYLSKDNLSYVIKLDDYEADFIPYFIIQNNLLNTFDKSNLNIILSTDKDLLQTCKFKNVIQCSTVYNKKEGKIEFNLLFDETAIGYIYKNFKPGILTSEYIPLILAISGDIADNIKGVRGIGEAKAYNLIVSNHLPSQIYENIDFKNDILNKEKDIIIRNYKLISFDEQLKRIPLTYLNHLSKKLN